MSLAAARNASRLALDIYDKPGEVKKIVRKLTEIYYEIFDLYYQVISEVQEGSITWIPTYSKGKYGALQNDFSGLVSPGMFEEFFLYGIKEFSEYLDNSIYRLDGSCALENLDYLLAIDSMDGIQWVPGAGTKPMREWIDVCSKVLDSGKCLQICCQPDEVEFLLSQLKHKELFLCTHCRTEEKAYDLLKRVENVTSERLAKK